MLKAIHQHLQILPATHKRLNTVWYLQTDLLGTLSTSYRNTKQLLRNKITTTAREAKTEPRLRAASSQMSDAHCLLLGCAIMCMQHMSCNAVSHTNRIARQLRHHCLPPVIVCGKLPAHFVLPMQRTYNRSIQEKQAGEQQAGKARTLAAGWRTQPQKEHRIRSYAQVHCMFVQVVGAC